MKIKTKLQISAVLSISIALVISLVLFLASQEVDQAVQQSRAVYQIVKNVFELNLLLNDFLLRHGEQTEAGWQMKHESLGKLLAELSVRTMEEQQMLKEVRKNHTKTKALFQQLVAGNKEQRRNKDEIISFLDLEEKVVGLLSAESQSMVSHVTRLGEASHTKAVDAQQKAGALVVLFTAIVTTVLAVTLLMISRAVVRPITRLKEATGVIAGGNLDHKVDITSRDEIGQLASAFNKMTDKLKDSYKGLQDAFNEMSRKLRETRKTLEKESDERKHMAEELEKLREGGSR